jgi:hypothetical protein
LCSHILKFFDRHAIRYVPARYIKAMWSNEEWADDQENIRLAPLELNAQGRHSVRYFRVCNNFAYFARPSVKDDDEYKVIVKYLDLMQKVLELKKRKASNISQTDQVCSSTMNSLTLNLFHFDR